MSENKKNSSSKAGYVLATLAGVVIGGIGSLIYSGIKDDKKTNDGDKGQKVKSQVDNNQNVNQTANQFEQNENIFCPISFVPMTDPYLLKNCGHSFQKETIDQCLQKKLECPLCRKQCQKEDLVPNFSLKSIVEDMIKNQKQ
ncbi:hypothetical protein ABPG72_007146 [Tetrahymena utriculariae]